MNREYDHRILDHYDKQAAELGLNPAVTMLDSTVRERETRLIEHFVTLCVNRLRKSGFHDNQITVCDVGCGNGTTLEVLRLGFPEVMFHGIELTPSMLELAQNRFRDTPNVTVSHGDVRNLKIGKLFNILLCQRVLINLLDSDDQKSALRKLAGTMEKGGYFLSIEAFSEPMDSLNTARTEFGMPPLEPAHHNLYLSSNFYTSEPSLVPLEGPRLEEGLAIDFLPANFLSSHYFVSRVIHPLALGPDRPFLRNSHFVAFLTEAIDRPIGDFSPIKAHSFIKQPLS